VPDTVKPPFSSWDSPSGLPSDLTPQQLDAIRAWLEQNPPRIGIQQISGFQRVIAGTVKGTDGSILRETPAGTFTPTRSAVGKYSVAFKSGMFQLPPSVTVSYSALSGGGAPNNRSITYGNVTKAGFDVELMDPVPNFDDKDWSFTAQGS
jgi:hypothetical protein